MTSDTRPGSPSDGRRKSPQLRTVALLPTPEAKLHDSGPDYTRAARDGSGGDDLTTAVHRHLLPTPTAQNAHGNQVNGRREVLLPGAVALLPTPSAGAWNDGEDVVQWDARRERVKAKGINGNGMGEPLSIAAARLLPTSQAADGDRESLTMYRGEGNPTLKGAAVALLPTPVTTDAKGARNATSGRQEGSEHHAGSTLTDALCAPGGRHDRPTAAGAAEGVRDVRGPAGAQALRDATGGPRSLPAPPALFADLREHQDPGGAPGPAPAGPAAPCTELHQLREDRRPARPPRRPRPDEQRAEQPGDPVRLVPPAAALAGGPTAAPGGRTAGSADGARPWGPYTAAIRRWEVVLGRPAPAPTTRGTRGQPRLSVAFTEWMMGLPPGHVTQAPHANVQVDLFGAVDPAATRQEQLRMLGNGVVPQQAALAVAAMLPELPGHVRDALGLDS